MNEITFSYKTYKKTHYPIIPIEITNKRTKIKTNAYVDSGASLSVFSIKEAVRLGLDRRSGRKATITVGDGSFVTIHLHRLSVKIGHSHLKATIGFSPRLSVNLIGRKDIFEFFDITFSDKDKIVSFYPRKASIKPAD